MFDHARTHGARIALGAALAGALTAGALAGPAMAIIAIL